jgi:hypothetical protein
LISGEVEKLNRLPVINHKWLKISIFVTALFLVYALAISGDFLAPSTALPEYGENCLLCHQSGGITVLTNASSLQVEPKTSFGLEISAEGGESEKMMIAWSEVGHNTFFSFSPTEVSDNDINDRQTEGGEIQGHFNVIAPNIEGNYVLRVFSSSSGGKGNFIDVNIVVGAGGEILVPITLQEIVRGLITTVTPTIFILMSLFGLALYIINWKRVP